MEEGGWWTDFAIRRFCYQGNVWRHFWLSQQRNATGIQWVEAKDPVKLPTIHRTAAQNKELAGQRVNNAKDEKPSKHQRIKNSNTDKNSF